MSFVSIVQRFAMNMRRAIMQYIGSAVAFHGQSSSRLLLMQIALAREFNDLFVLF